MSALTRQEMFDRAARGVLKQGVRCVVKNTGSSKMSCAYRDAEGNHCGVGHMLADLPDDHPVWSYGSIVSRLCTAYPDVSELLNFAENHRFLDAMQIVHGMAGERLTDGSTLESVRQLDVKKFKESMRVKAEYYDLNADILDEVAA